MELFGDNVSRIKRGLVDVCVDMQNRAIELTEKLFKEKNRYYYVTPTSYLELLAIFR
jgi:dynein heavy chain